MYEGLTPTPDRGFVRDLRAYDPNLHCEFDRENGKFAVLQDLPEGGRRVLFLIEGWEHAGGWRQPDARDLAVLALADFWRGKDLKRRMLEGEQRIIDHHVSQERKVTEELRDATKDDKYQLIRAYQDAGNLGKGTRPFRQVTPKTKGKVFK